MRGAAARVGQAAMVAAAFLALGGPWDAVLAQAPADETTAVSDLVVRSTSLRPESDVPRFTQEQLGELREYARENFTAALNNEGRGDRGLVTTHGARQAAVNPNSRGATYSMETPIQIMGVLGASEGRKRNFYRQLDRAAEAAEKATAAADLAFQNWLQGRGGREAVVDMENARAAAVRTLLEVRRKAEEEIDAADALAWNAIGAIAFESHDGPDKQATPQPGLPPSDREAVFMAMEAREYRLAAEAAARNLKLEGVAARPVVADGKVVGVRVSGLIRNNADVDSKIPPFNIVFYDEKNEAFAGMLVQPDENGVAANSGKRFSLDLGMSGEARISRVALVFGTPSYRPRLGAVVAR